MKEEFVVVCMRRRLRNLCSEKYYKVRYSCTGHAHVLSGSAAWLLSFSIAFLTFSCVALGSRAVYNSKEMY